MNSLEGQSGEGVRDDLSPSVGLWISLLSVAAVYAVACVVYLIYQGGL